MMCESIERDDGQSLACTSGSLEPINRVKMSINFIISELLGHPLSEEEARLLY